MRPAQGSPPVTQAWVRQYSDPVSGTHNANAIGVDGAGNVYVTGEGFTTISYAPDGAVRWVRGDAGPGTQQGAAYALAVDDLANVYVTGASPQADANLDITTVSYASDGTLRWVRHYNGVAGSADFGRAIALDSARNVYVTGESAGNSTDKDFATVSYDTTGNERWVRRYDGPVNGTDQPQAITVDDSGNVFVAGSSDGGVVTGHDFATVSYDDAGTLRWVRRYNGPMSGGDGARTVAADANGNIYVGGVSFEPAFNAYFTTVSYDGAGNLRWSRRYEDPANPSGEARAVMVDGSGNVTVTGRLGAGTYVTEGILTVSYTAAGVQRWSAHYANTAESGASGLAVDAVGNVYVTGAALLTDAGPEFLTVSYSPTGAVRWTATYGDPTSHKDVPNAIAADAAGNIYVTGINAMGPAGRFNISATVKYVQEVPDTTPPACQVGAVVSSGGRVYVPVTVTDSESGVALVQLTNNSSNCKLEWDGPSGTVTVPIGGTISISPPAASATVRAVKLNNSQKARVELRVTDAAGNVIVCDPVIANLEIKKARRLTRTFNKLPEHEHFVTLQNGTPGLDTAKVWVNGKLVSHGALSDGQILRLNVQQWMRGGNRNTVRVAVTGTKGASAVLLIGDSSLAGSHVHSGGSTGLNTEFAR